MIEKIKPVNNPLTIVGIFAALSEVFSIGVLGFIDKGLQIIFIWFIMGFPLILVLAFFITLNFNPIVLYAPKDFRKDENFISIYNKIKEPINLESENLEEKGFKEKDIEYIVDKLYENQIVEIDNKSFYKCEFKNCEIRYKGNGIFYIVECKIDNVTWAFSDSAKNTLIAMSNLYTGFREYGQELIELTFDNIRKGYR